MNSVGMLTIWTDRARLAAALLRREYATQFAGMGPGLIWLGLQYLAQIGVFLLVFGRGIYHGQDAGDYASRLLAGMLLWLPLSEMLTRSTTILSDNRALIRRTAVGRDLFPWLPVMQAMLQYVMLSIPVSAALLFSATLSRSAIAGLLFGLATVLFFSVWSIILARSTILLRDIGPIIRPSLQAIFWLTPIAYYATSWSLWNPLTWIFHIHNILWLSSRPAAGGASSTSEIEPGLPAFFAFAIITFVALLGSFRLKRVVEDHL